MLTVRRAADRGHFDHGWLDTYHSFSFADYVDPRFMGFRSLRVLNEDRVAPGAGFPMHGHKDMEILTYVVAGALEHRDNMGNHAVVRPGEVQVMSAGTGVMHSEANPSRTEPVHLLQIWIVPSRKGLPPRYGQKSIPDLRPIVTIADAEGRGDVVRIHQDVAVKLVRLDAGQRTGLAFAAGRAGWIQVVDGDLVVGDGRVGAGDAVAVTDELRVELAAKTAATALAFDLS